MLLVDIATAVAASKLAVVILPIKLIASLFPLFKIKLLGHQQR